MFEHFSRAIFDAFTQPLPGKAAQLPLKPYLKISRHLEPPMLLNPKIGAVMSLIYPVNNIPHVLLIERPIYKGAHSGQLAFPGGKIEQTDASYLDAALRETYEEVGIQSDLVQVAGSLTEVYVLASNFIVYPFVGILEKAPVITPDPKEVAGILEIPLTTFVRPDIIKTKPMKSALGMTLMAPYYDINGKVLWGATAMMVSELQTILQKNGIPLQ